MSSGRNRAPPANGGRPTAIVVFVLAVGGLSMAAGLHAQEYPGASTDPAGASAPGLAGRTLFLVPAAETALGRLRLAGALRVEWGNVDGIGGQAAVGVALTPTVTATLGWRGTSATAGRESYADRALSLALAGSRAGIAGLYRSADAATGAFSTRARDLELSAWARLGLDVRVTVRSTEAVETAEATWDRIFEIGGYEFISRRTVSRLDAIRYQDVEFHLGAPLGPVWVTGVAGRGFARDIVQGRQWAYLRVTAPVRDRLVMVAEAGREGGLPTIGRGPGGFARLGLHARLAGAGTRVPDSPEAAPAPDPGDDLAARARVDGGQPPTLRITAATARSVEVRGNFTGWVPRPMEPAGDGVWTVPVTAGVLRFDIRLDGADWTVPADVPVFPDEFTGAPVAVLVVDG